eukprot:5675006-Pleurochrysis_carterae.AAC.1
MASVHPTSAMVSATAETNPKAEAYISNARRTLRAIEAEASRKQVAEKVMKTVESNMQTGACVLGRTRRRRSTISRQL